MRIFITGASGFVGGTFLSATADTHILSAMPGGETPDKKILETGATPVRCSLDDVTADHMAGADAVIHAATYVEQWRTPYDFWHTNVEGTERLLSEAKKAGVKRFFHVGTKAELLEGQALVNVVETYPLALKFTLSLFRAQRHMQRSPFGKLMILQTVLNPSSCVHALYGDRATSGCCLASET